MHSIKLSCFLITVASVAGLGLAPLQAAVTVDFTGAFVVGNWTQVPAAGSINLGGAPGSISLTSSDNGGGNQNTDFFITAPEDGTVAFDWSYVTSDGPTFDPFFYLINGSGTQVTNDLGAQSQSGSVSFTVTTGQTFGFRANSLDSILGAATTTISNFEFASLTAVPEPGNVFGTALLLGSVCTIRMRARRRTVAA